MMQFKNYMQTEGAEIFGYEHESAASRVDKTSPNVQDHDDNFPMPLVRFDSTYMADLIAQHALGEKQPFKRFFDHVQWGVGPGAVRLRLGTKFDIIIERQSPDLRGQLTWVAKRLFNINRENFSGKERSVAEELMEELHLVDELPPDSPNQSYEEFERLIAAVSRRTAIIVNDPLFHEGIKKLNDNNFIIYFGVRGQGVGAPDHRRVEEVIIDLSFNPRTGVVKMIETNVESPLGVSQWGLMPSDFELKFMPSQERDDIVRIIATIMKFF